MARCFSRSLRFICNPGNHSSTKTKSSVDDQLEEQKTGRQLIVHSLFIETKKKEQAGNDVTQANRGTDKNNAFEKVTFLL